MVFFVWAGRTGEALEILETIEAELAPPWKGLVALGYMVVYAVEEDPDRLEDALADLEEFVESQNAGYLRDDIYWGEGRMEEARGNYAAAIECYQRKLELTPTDVTSWRAIGRCQRELGRYEAAVASIEKMLAIYPNNPRANYEVALARRGLGDTDQATVAMERAVDLWKHADPSYRIAQEARATLDRWQNPSP
jgi:tetratricopeptide (TPR) repeat protein